MSEFKTELNAALKPGSDSIWIINKPLVYSSDLVGIFAVPEGFETDFASVPRIPIAYMTFGDRAHREAVLHDYLYRIDSEPCVTFMQANKVFLEAMKLRGKSFFLRWAMYMGVVAGGYFSYHKKSVSDKL